MHTGCATYGNATLAITLFQLPSPHRSGGTLRPYRLQSDICRKTASRRSPKFDKSFDQPAERLPNTRPSTQCTPRPPGAKSDEAQRYADTSALLGTRPSAIAI